MSFLSKYMKDFSCMKSENIFHDTQGAKSGLVSRSDKLWLNGIELSNVSLRLVTNRNVSCRSCPSRWCSHTPVRIIKKDSRLRGADLLYNPYLPPLCYEQRLIWIVWNLCDLLDVPVVHGPWYWPLPIFRASLGVGLNERIGHSEVSVSLNHMNDHWYLI